MVTVALSAYRTMLGRDNSMAIERNFTLAVGIASACTVLTTFALLYVESPSGNNMRGRK